MSKLVTFETTYEPSGSPTDIHVAHSLLLRLFEHDTECIRLKLDQKLKEMRIEFYLQSA